MEENNRPIDPQSPMNEQADNVPKNSEQQFQGQPDYSQTGYAPQNPGQPNAGQQYAAQQNNAQQNMNQQGYAQSNFNQPIYNQPNYNQQGFTQPGQPNYQQPDYTQQAPGQPNYQQPNFTQQAPGQQNFGQNNRESTYWETNPTGQYQSTGNTQNPGYPAGQQNFNQASPNYNQQQAPSGQWSGTPQQPQNQTPEQFYQYYQQQMGPAMGNQTNYGQPQYNQPVYQPAAAAKPPKKKKHRGALVAVLVIVLLLASAAATAYAFRDTLMNSYAKMTKSPLDYYTYLEKNEIDAAAGEITAPSNAPLLNSTPASYEVNSDITFDRDTVDSLMQSSLGMSLADIESMIGIQFNNIGVDAKVGTDGNIINETLGLRLNQVNLITAELFLDNAAQKIFLRLPELSQAYLSVSPEDVSSGTDMSKLENITPESIADLLKRYSYLVIDNVKQVELEENTELSIDTLSTKCTKLTVTITEEDALNMVLAVLKEAREDQFILDLLPMLNMTVEEYQSSVDQAIADCQDSFAEMTDETIEMAVYVNSKGEILGRQISSDSTEASFGYTTLSKGSYEEYKAFLTDDTGAEVFNLDGSQTKSDGAYTGDATVKVSSPDQTFTDVTVSISYNDVRTETKNNRTYQYGNFNISSLDLMGLQLTMDYYVENDAQKCKFDLKMGAASLVTMDMTMKYLDNYEVTMPGQDAEVYDATTQAESYAATIDIEGYISRLSEQLGVDLQSLYDSLMPGSDY